MNTDKIKGFNELSKENKELVLEYLNSLENANELSDIEVFYANLKETRGLSQTCQETGKRIKKIIYRNIDKLNEAGEVVENYHEYTLSTKYDQRKFLQTKDVNFVFLKHEKLEGTQYIDLTYWTCGNERGMEYKLRNLESYVVCPEVELI